MALSTPLLVRSLLSLLLLLPLPPALRDFYLPVSDQGPQLQPKHAAASSELEPEELHPVVLVAGLFCSDLEARLTEAYLPSTATPRRCGAMKGKGWFPLWKNVSDLVAHDYVGCFLEQMRLVYDPAADDYRNLPGVETRVPNFGSARAFRNKDPAQPDRCFDYLIRGLERAGYVDGDTLFGAPYDWRYAPPVPGQPSQYYSCYFKRLKALVEEATSSKKKKVVIFGHSYGGTVALEFLRSTPLAWRNEHIERLILAAPAISSTGFVLQMLSTVSGPGIGYIAGATDLSLRTMWRTFETALMGLPSPKVFGRTPIVVTQQRNYSAYDMQDFLLAIGFSDGIEPFRRRMVPKMSYLRAPMVPMTCINGVGVGTAEQVAYQEMSDHAMMSPAGIVYGDGDGTVNLISMLAFDREMTGQPGQKEQFKSIKIHGAQHSRLITDEWALKRVIQEILEANRI